MESEKITMPFGKYKGLYISQLPSDYLLWVAENISDGPICYAADQEYQFREKFNKHWYKKGLWR